MEEKLSLKSQLKKETGISPMDCYQCGKCSAGCPMAIEMDYPPSMVMRMLQTDDPALAEKILSSDSIWFCLSCEMCYGRCPMEIDIPVIMDFLRSVSVRQGKVSPGAKKILSFHKAFLNSIKNNGKLHELGLIIGYKMRSFDLMQDVALAPKMISRGKLRFVSKKNKGMKNIKDIFARTLNK